MTEYRRTAKYPRGGSDQSGIRVAEAVLWGAVISVVSVGAWGGVLGVWVPSALATAFGILTYLRAGGSQITATGIWGLALALFVGVAGLLLGAEGYGRDVPLSQAIAIALSFSYLVVVCRNAMGRTRRPAGQHKVEATSAATWMILALGSYVIGLSLKQSPAMSSLSGGFTFAGVAVAALGASASRSRLSLLLPAVLFVWSAFVEWTGSGRLVLLQLAIAVLLIYTYRAGVHGSWAKWALALSLPPALALGGMVELNRRATDGRGLLAPTPEGFRFGEGLDSLKSPILLLGRIIEERISGALPLHWLETFYATLVVPIPRSLWPGKPDGWGRVLAHDYSYSKWATSGHSEAALLPAEFIWGFGFVGLVLGVLVSAWLLGSIDEGLVRYADRMFTPGTAGISIVPWSILAAGILSLWWAGTFTFWARSSLALIAVLAMHLLARILSPEQRTTQPGPTRASPPDPRKMRGSIETARRLP